MGLPAIDRRYSQKRETGPRIRLVRSSPKQKNTSRKSSRPSSAKRPERSRDIFVMWAILLVGLSIFGLGRVTLSVKATEASFEAGRLREDIKAEQRVGDLLEVDKSALTVPSRIESIAGSTMQMAEADNVSYLSLPEGVISEDAEPSFLDGGQDADTVSSVEEEPSVFATLMEMAAEEAQVLLVGDLGLASSR